VVLSSEDNEAPKIVSGQPNLPDFGQVDFRFGIAVKTTLDLR
jgi:hypothetical protein